MIRGPGTGEAQWGAPQLGKRYNEVENKVRNEGASLKALRINQHTGGILCVFYM